MSKLLATGFDFPEGPVFDQWGQLYICDVFAQAIYQIDLKHQTKKLWVKFDGQPNGATFDPVDQGLLIADSKRGRIVHLGYDGFETTLLERSDLLGPNDLTVDAEGIIYFTDPTWKKGHEKIPQHVYALHPDGVLAKYGKFKQPNGIKFRKGRLFVAEGATGIIWETTPSQMKFSPWAVARSTEGVQSFCLDGLEVDSRGWVYVAAYDLGVIRVFNQKGQPIGQIDLPDSSPTNLEFNAKEDLLVITEAKHGRVFTVPAFNPSQCVSHKTSSRFNSDATY